MRTKFLNKNSAAIVVILFRWLCDPSNNKSLWNINLVLVSILIFFLSHILTGCGTSVSHMESLKDFNARTIASFSYRNLLFFKLCQKKIKESLKKWDPEEFQDWLHYNHQQLLLSLPGHQMNCFFVFLRDEHIFGLVWVYYDFIPTQKAKLFTTMFVLFSVFLLLHF